MSERRLDSSEHVGEERGREDTASVEGDQGNSPTLLAFKLNLTKVITQRFSSAQYQLTGLLAYATPVIKGKGNGSRRDSQLVSDLFCGNGHRGSYHSFTNN